MNFIKSKDNLYKDIDFEKAIKDFQYLIRCKSVSYLDQNKMDFNEFKKIHNYMLTNFPNINKYAKYEFIDKGAIYFSIEGKNKDLGALLLMGHIDVVPPINESAWDFAPFSGIIKDDEICGRGAADMKHIDSALLNAVDYALKNGQPERTIYLCFGSDEETLGMHGQWLIKERLKELKANIAMVLDEGSSIVDGDTYSSSSSLALVNVCEKGYLDLIIEGKNKGGHSSNPHGKTSLSEVCEAISRIMNNPLENKLNEPLKEFYKRIKDTITDSKLKEYVEKIDEDETLLANYLSSSYLLNPLVHTTIAPTMIDNDSKGANVLPQNTKALINFRLASFDKSDDVIKKYQELCSDLEVSIYKDNSIEASTISSIKSNEYNLLKETIEEFFEGVIVVPGMTVGGTDCCFYNELCANCYRFSPIVNPKEIATSGHGINERCKIEAYKYGIKFYVGLINKFCY